MAVRQGQLASGERKAERKIEMIEMEAEVEVEMKMEMRVKEREGEGKGRRGGNERQVCWRWS